MKITIKANRQLPQKRSKNVYASRTQKSLNRRTPCRSVKASYDRSRYDRIVTKSVPDTDGFMTDYTMYFDKETGLYIFILGDNEIYNPDNAEPDFECETNEEATEWWNSYGEEDDVYSSTKIRRNTKNVTASQKNNRTIRKPSNVSASRSTKKKFYVRAHRSVTDWLETIADQIYELPEIADFKWDKGHRRCIFTVDNAPGVEFYFYGQRNDFIWESSSSGYSRIHFEDYSDVDEFIDNIQWEIQTPIGDVMSSTAISASKDLAISQEDALDFLNSLPESRLGKVYHEYNTRNNDELSYIIDDKDLLDLGYKPSIQASEQGTVQTFCDGCGARNRVKVNFPDSNSPFEDTEYTCTECGAVNSLTDPHTYDESGKIVSSSDVMAYDEAGLDSLWEEISSISQEFTSENTSINSGKLPAIFNLVKFESGTVNLDYGGGKFDNVAEYLAKQEVVNLVLDPYNRTAEHNKEVIDLIRKAGGADTATCSNVLNVIKEPEVRNYVMSNIKKLVKDGGKVYFTVYEGNGSGEGKETKSGYQLNRKTKDYMEEIQAMFPDAKRKGKLIIATNSSTAVNSASRIMASVSDFDIADVFNVASDTIDPDAGSVNAIAGANTTISYDHFRIFEYDVGSYVVFIDNDGLIQIYSGEGGVSCASCGSLEAFRKYCQQINNGHRQMMDEYEGNYSANASTRIGAAVSYGFEPQETEPEELDATVEEIEIPFDCNVILDEYTWEYTDPKCDWAAGTGSNGSWYSDNGTLIGDQDSIVECVNDLLSDLLPAGTGTYHISGTAILVFDVYGGVKYSRFSGKDEDNDPIIDEDIDLTDSQADFDLQSSSIKNFKYEELN